ncbi:MAG: c-type cytochrome [Litorivicinus sp.]
MKTLITLGAALCLALPASAAEPKDLIDARQGAYKIIKYEFADNIAAMMRGKKEFDLERMKVAVDRIQTVSGILPEAFAVESTASNSRAKAEIWSDSEGFRAAAMEFGQAMGALSAAVDSGDRGQIGAALKQAGQSCKGCHDSYRSK